MSHYKPYPAYKDSGVAWLEQVPEHWQIKQLKYLASHMAVGKLRQVVPRFIKTLGCCFYAARTSMKMAFGWMTRLSFLMR
ncbi:type I restriction-modification system subunit S [Pseudomonas aeruginosa]|nr:type I restriction-modification system subunit S [Pseudomonas aeruginosa]